MMTRRQRGQKGFFAHSELALELRLFVCRYDEERREPTEKKKKTEAGREVSNKQIINRNQVHGGAS